MDGRKKARMKIEDTKSFTVNTLQLSSNSGSGLQVNFRTQKSASYASHLNRSAINAALT
jgi:hypothetical protein